MLLRRESYDFGIIKCYKNKGISLHKLHISYFFVGFCIKLHSHEKPEICVICWTLCNSLCDVYLSKTSEKREVLSASRFNVVLQMLKVFLMYIQLMLEFLKTPFLVLHFFYSTLMTLLMMLSVILVSMLMILLSILSVIRHLICGNN